MWLLSDEVAGCEVELETKVSEDYAKIAQSQRRSLHKGLLLVESAYYCFHI